MNKIFNKLHNYLKNLSTIKFIAMIVLFTCLVCIPSMPVFYLEEKYVGAKRSIDLGSFFSIEFIFTIILAPIIETFIFQYGIIEILYSIKYFKGKNIIIAIISALLFGIAHSDSLLYILLGFILGLLLAYSYIVYKKKNFSAFGVVFGFIV